MEKVDSNILCFNAIKDVCNQFQKCKSYSEYIGKIFETFRNAFSAERCILIMLKEENTNGKTINDCDRMYSFPADLTIPQNGIPAYRYPYEGTPFSKKYSKICIKLNAQVNQIINEPDKNFFWLPITDTIDGHDKIRGVFILVFSKHSLNTQTTESKKSLNIAFSISNVLGLVINQFIKDKQLQIDGLTEIYNRRFFNETIKSLIDKGNNFSIAMIDIDNFKIINDRYGHNTGDDVLKRVAGMLKEAEQKGGMVFRYGGEEFAVIFPFKKEDAFKEIDRIRKDIDEKGKFADKNGVPLDVTISFGVAEYPLDTAQDYDKDDPVIVRLADNALYFSKCNKKNIGTLYNEDELKFFTKKRRTECLRCPYVGLIEVHKGLMQRECKKCIRETNIQSKSEKRKYKDSEGCSGQISKNEAAATAESQ